MTYKDLEIYKISLELFFKVHEASLKLPKYEIYELGSQVRRSSDSANSNIVEGYGRRYYKKDYIRFLFFSHGSCLETIGHCVKISRLYTHLIKEFDEFENEYELLGGKIFNFIKYVQNNWNPPNLLC